MHWFDRIFGWLSSGNMGDSSPDSVPSQDETCTTNPATGLPMVSGWGGVDVGGNPYGMNLHDNWTHSTSWDSSSSDSNNWDSGISSSWDD